MPEYRYVIVSSDGRSWLLQGDELYDSNADQNHVLPRLLRDGWHPIRERSMGGRENAFSLVLLREFLAETGEDIPF